MNLINPQQTGYIGARDHHCEGTCIIGLEGHTYSTSAGEAQSGEETAG